MERTPGSSGTRRMADATSRSGPSRLGLLLLTPALLWLLVFMVVPLATLLPGSLQATDGSWTLANYRRFLTDPFYLRILLDTMLWAGIVTVICIVVSFPVAIFLTRTGPK